MNLNMAWDTPKAAGLLVLGALAVLVTLRKVFGGVSINIGD